MWRWGLQTSPKPLRWRYQTRSPYRKASGSNAHSQLHPWRIQISWRKLPWGRSLSKRATISLLITHIDPSPFWSLIFVKIEQSRNRAHTDILTLKRRRGDVMWMLQPRDDNNLADIILARRQISKALDPIWGVGVNLRSWFVIWVTFRSFAFAVQRTCNGQICIDICPSWSYSKTRLTFNGIKRLIVAWKKFHTLPLVVCRNRVMTCLGTRRIRFYYSQSGSSWPTPCFWQWRRS